MATKPDAFEGTTPATTDDPFSTPGAFKGSKPPKMAQLASGAPKVKRTYAPGDPQEQIVETMGRLVVIKPVQYDPAHKSPLGTQPMMTCDVHVINGADITDVLDKDGDVVFTPDKPWVAPFTLKSMWIQGVMILGQLMPFYEAGTAAVGTLGRLPAQGSNSKPYVLVSVTDDERAAAAKYYLKYLADEEKAAF